MSVYVPRAAAEKAGPVGPGAGPLMTEFLLNGALPADQHRKMAQAVNIGREVAYVRLAEMTISSKIADPLMGVAWHLEDPDGETVDDAYPDPRAREAFALVDRPMANASKGSTVRTREEIWEVTSRHMGLAGQGAWFLDQLNDFGIPAAMCYVRPDRLTEVMAGPKGNQSLDHWRLDVSPGSEGTRLEADEVLLVQLQTPDDGVWAPGLVESALGKALLNGAVDKHFAQTLAGAGRLAGILAPKQGTIDDDGVWGQLQRDARNVTEQPESARRLQVMRGPMDFIRTAATPAEMALIDLMGRNRDDLLAVWRVPLSQIGGTSPAGMNSGDIRKYDQAALWENAVTPRLSRFSAALGTILDRFAAYLGWAPALVFDIPEFDDDSPRFDKLQKAQFIALTEDERRSLIGLDPLPRERIGPTGIPMGDEIWRPNTQSPVGIAPTPEPTILAQGMQAPSWSAYQPTAPSASAVAQGMAPVPGNASAQAQGVPVGKAKPVSGPDVVAAVLAALKKQWPASELDIVRRGSWTFVPDFPVKKVNADRRPIARNPKIVAGVEAARAVGAPIDPVTLVHTKRIGKPGYEPIDGWHRMLALQHAGAKTVPAYVGDGDDAWTRELIAFDDDIPTPPDDASDEEPGEPDEAAAKAALHEALTALRSRVAAQATPGLRASVATVLGQQRREVAGRVRAHAAALAVNPRDTTLWWPKDDRYDVALRQALSPGLSRMAQAVQAHIAAEVPPRKAGPAATGGVARVLSRGAARVTGINETTRAGIDALVQQGLDEGLSPAALGDLVEAWSGFDEYRGELIARTELMDAYNAAALGSYRELGVETVIAVDGDGDDECAARDGQPYPLDEADAIEDHPNGTLDWIPKASLAPAAVRRPRSPAAEAILRTLEASEGASRAEAAGMAASFAEAVKAMASQPIQVTVNPTPVTLPAPVVNVEAPVVNVPPPARRTVRRVERDADGNITRVVEE